MIQNKNIIVNLISSDKDSLLFNLKFLEELEYFDGHFDDFKLLPALIQVKIVSDFCTEYFDTLCEITDIGNMKFLKPICPGREVSLSLTLSHEGERLNFKYFVNDIIYSSGTIRL
jgi:3-hydroxymyristoyl/3-hydroxydecanoyl-(acyl carrier protein) dehydratase